MKKIDNYINFNIPHLLAETSIEESMKIFIDGNFNSLPIIDELEMPLGRLSYITASNAADKSQSVMSIANRSIDTITNFYDLEQLLILNDSKIDDFLIVTYPDGRYKGILDTDAIIKILYYDARYTENILNSIDAGIVAIDGEKKIIFYNDEFKRIHAIKDNQLLGEDVMGKFPESYITAVLNGDAKNIPYEPLNLRYSGATVLPHYSAIFNENKEIIGSVAIVKDYSKTAEIALTVRELKSLNYLFSSIFNNLSEMVFSVDSKNVILYANPAFGEMFDQVSGEQLNIVDINEFVSEIMDRSMRVVAKKEIEMKDRHGNKVNLALSLFPLVDSLNSMNGAICIIQDMTSISKLKEEICHTNNIIKYYEKQFNILPRNMVCESPAFKNVLSTAFKVAKMDITVLIEGESGVGKDMVATYIQMNSTRANKPFIPVNCGSIPESLWESEMFGYEDGSFTGAKKGGKLGIVELANKGTLFLDEIGSLSLAAQVKLLRFLENMEISKVGMSEIKKLDIRIIAASNNSLEEMVAQGKFREDLFYRINVIKLEIPPLRERMDDIIILAKSFIERFGTKYQKKVSISDEVIDILINYQWPGNVRQLKNVMEHCVALCDDVILPCHMPQKMLDTGKCASPLLKQAGNVEELSKSIKQTEEESIREALRICNNNKTKAMNMLNISRRTFYKKLREYNIE
ncbi:MAG: PAS domain S-box protein [Clostridia bacterium]|nr:PAS domain S-box protein [Clostridia bacterium]